MKTTIAITPKTRKILQEYGKKSETYDDVIKRMRNELEIRDKVTEYENPEEWVSIDDAIKHAKEATKNLK